MDHFSIWFGRGASPADGEMVMMDLDKGTRCGFDSTGVSIREALDAGRAIEAMHHTSLPLLTKGD
jgi:hypothetical protein